MIRHGDVLALFSGPKAAHKAPKLARCGSAQCPPRPGNSAGLATRGQTIALVVQRLLESVDRLNVLRARGVMSFQAASAVALAISASRRSAGNLCTTPLGTRWLLTKPR
jgi:hypothetical protein